MFAFLPIHKPRGLNSRRVVDALEDATDQKAGHAGTLDPLASGVLLTALGPATRLIPYAQRLAKCYTARFQLGIESDSDDTERICRPVSVDSIPDAETLAATVARFVGSIEQTPPAFSAVRVNGRRAYRLAHRGREFAISPRPVTIHAIQLIRYAFPFFELAVRCGPGTYIRSLGRDIAAALGTKCVMTELSRDAIGPFDLNRCASFEEIANGDYRDKLIDPIALFGELPVVAVDEYDLERIARGVKYDPPAPIAAPEILLTDRQGRLHAVLRPAPDGKWRPALNFSKFWRGIPARMHRTI